MRAREVAMPARPSLPPLFICALCAWAGIFAAEEASWRVYADSLPPSAIVLIFIALAVVGVLLMRMTRKRRRSNTRAPALYALALAMAFICGWLYWGAWADDVRSIGTEDVNGPAYIIELTGDPQVRDYGIVSSGRIDRTNRTCALRLIWNDDASPLAAGHLVMVVGSALSIGQDEGGKWNHQNGYVATIRASNVEDLGYAPSIQGMLASFRETAFERISALGDTAAPLLSGVVLGNRTLYAGTELERAFQTTGLAHLMAVSGTHLAVVSSLLMMALSQSPLRRNARSILLVAALIIYAAITAFTPSALRACIMCAIALLAGMFKRRKSILNALGLCVFFFLSLSPSIAFSTGFCLSVLAVMGIVVFAPLFQAWIQWLLKGDGRAFASVFATTLAASLATSPVSIPLFAQAPLISPLANLLAAPLITAMLSLGLLGVTIGAALPPLGMLLLGVAGSISAFCSALVQFMADIPGACLPMEGESYILGMLFGAVALVLWVVWPTPERCESFSKKTLVSDKPLSLSSDHARRAGAPKLVFCGAALVPLLLFIATTAALQNIDAGASNARIVMLDVGQGDSILIESEGARVLVDTGEDGEVLLKQLARQGVTHVDAVVITHKDADHAGALRKLAGVVGVEHVYVHEELLDAEIMSSVLEAASWVTNGRGAEGVSMGSAFSIGRFSLRVLDPEHARTSSNEESLVMLVEYDAESDGEIEARGLLTGDAESDAVAHAVNAAGDVDFLKVAHHGSKGGLTDEELETLSPEIALIGVGAGNRYGHPATSTLRQLEARTCKVYRTDKQGAVTLYFTKDRIKITTERGA